MCRSCRRQFANTNQWHSCIELALDEHLAAKSDLGVELYSTVESALRVCGEFRIHPQKSRVAFIARMTFAGVRLATRWADLSFILARPLDDRRIRSLEMYGPTSFGHHVRIADPSEVDRDVRAWLCEAHSRGQQETLDSKATVEPLVGIALERVLVPLRTRVVDTVDGLALRLPVYAAQAFGAHPYVTARVGRNRYAAEIRTDEGRPVMFMGDVLNQLGLGSGDETDAFLTADL